MLDAPMNQQPKRPSQRQIPPGKIEVAPQVIAKIAALAARCSSGVAGMASHTVHDDAALVLRRRDAHRGVEVRVNDGEVAIEVFIIVEYGARIADVARAVQEDVRRAIEQTLGVQHARVSVRVQGLQTTH